MTKLLGPLAVALLLVAGCETTESRIADGSEAHAVHEGKVAPDQVPANVLEAAKKAVPGLVVTGAEGEVEHGVQVYDVTGTADGTIYEVEVTADGKVNEIEKGGDDGEDDADGGDDD